MSTPWLCRCGAAFDRLADLDIHQSCDPHPPRETLRAPTAERLVIEGYERENLTDGEKLKLLWAAARRHHWI